ncbi:MAG: hypothetical protein JWS12_962 [Candidatus Saccharibacteria bacterium]|nr:hypothetical protein [Candidatus Saccharibacteria bacterium]
MNPQTPNQQPAQNNSAAAPNGSGMTTDNVLPSPAASPIPAAPLQAMAPNTAFPTAPPSPVPSPNAIYPPQPAATGNPQPPAIQPKINPNSTQNTLQIAEIRDGIAIMNDGSFRSVVMVKSINFDLMSQQEREAVEYSYQGFLNSLYFPVQIFVRSQKVDLRPYIERLDKIRSEHDNMLLAMLMEDYIGFIDNLSLQTNIMDKKFYIVVPYFPVTIDLQKPIEASKGLFKGVAGLFNNKQDHVTINEADLEKAKTELRNRVQAVLSGLMQSGVQGLPLDTQELIELYYDTYNPDTATRQELKNFDELSAAVISKGTGNAPQPNLDRQMK